jgi:DNA-binding transcriptional LysR family regulator
MANITVRQIKMFISAAKHLNFTHAAKEIHVSAPAVSLQIKEMESLLNADLFIREGKSLQLTSAGEYFLPYAKQIVNTLSEASDMIDQLKGVDSRPLKIGLVSTAQYFLPHLLIQFKLQYQHIKILIEVRNRQQLVELLRDGKIDIAIMGIPPKEIDTRVEAFANHPHVFIASPLNPLAGKVNLAPDELSKAEIISRESGSGTRAIMESYFVEHNLSPIVSMEMSSNETIKQAVMADLGISFVSMHTIGNELANKQIAILDIQNTPIMRTWHVVALTKRNASQAAEAFRYFMLEKGGEILTKMFIAN